MIRLEGVSRVFELGEHKVNALVDITEEINAGAYVAIMGPSGSGKSTLLNILGCLDRPTSGDYSLEGRNVSGLRDDELAQVRRHKIGFVFQEMHLVPRLTAASNVELPMVFAGIPRSERRRRVREALHAVGLEERATHRPDQLSGGERQRVAIARATIMGPKLLLADEPTGNLDSASGSQVLDVLERMHQEGITIVLVTHDPTVASRADRVLVFADGRIVRRASSDEMSSIRQFFEQLKGAS